VDIQPSKSALLTADQHVQEMIFIIEATAISDAPIANTR
jgi:hypothetical protein